MKKFISTLGLTVTLLLAVQATSMAQAQDPGESPDGTIKVGGGLIYGTEIEQLGLKIDGYYTINEQFRAGADFGYFFPEDYPGGDLTWYEFNLNGNYIFTQEESLTAYGLAGLNFTTLDISADNGDFGGFSTSTTETGLNIGAGGEYAMDFGSLFAELKYVISDADQLVLGAGVRFVVN